MLEQILAADKALFFLINGQSNFVFDQLFSTVTDFGSWFLWLFIGILYVLQRKEVKGAVLVTGAFFGAVLTLLIKHIVSRPRPFEALSGVNMIIKEVGASFPSGHAVMAFFGAYTLSKFYPRLKWPLYGLAVLTAISRVYLGVHYPADVLAGAALGLIIGWFVFRIRLERFFKEEEIAVKKDVRKELRVLRKKLKKKIRKT